MRFLIAPFLLSLFFSFFFFSSNLIFEYCRLTVDALVNAFTLQKKKKKKNRSREIEIGSRVTCIHIYRFEFQIFGCVELGRLTVKEDRREDIGRFCTARTNEYFTSSKQREREREREREIILFSSVLAASFVESTLSNHC